MPMTLCKPVITRYLLLIYSREVWYGSPGRANYLVSFTESTISYMIHIWLLQWCLGYDTNSLYRIVLHHLYTTMGQYCVLVIMTSIFSVFLVACERNLGQRQISLTKNEAKLFCFLRCYREQPVEQTGDLLVMDKTVAVAQTAALLIQWDIFTLMWCNCNGAYRYLRNCIWLRHYGNFKYRNDNCIQWICSC